MSFIDRARQAAEQARKMATSPEAQEHMRQTGAQFREAAGQAKRGLVTAIEKIDPGILADIIIKATALQETANHALKSKRSAYRIGEITITATIPPQIGFAIVRTEDADEMGSQQLVETVASVDEVVSLDGQPAPVVEDSEA